MATSLPHQGFESLESLQTAGGLGRTPEQLSLGAQRSEVTLEQLGAFLGQDSGGHLDAVVQATVLRHVVERECGAGAAILRPVDQTAESSEHCRPGTHRAGLERDVERAVVEPPASQLGRRSLKRQNLGVGGRIAGGTPVRCELGR